MNRFCLLLLPAAVFVFFSCDPDPVPDVSGKQLLDPLFESAYMTMPPSSAGDFASPVRCFYTGRMLPPGRNVRFSETAETVPLLFTEKNMWQSEVPTAATAERAEMWFSV